MHSNTHHIQYKHEVHMVTLCFYMYSTWIGLGYCMHTFVHFLQLSALGWKGFATQEYATQAYRLATVPLILMGQTALLVSVAHGLVCILAESGNKCTCNLFVY